MSAGWPLRRGGSGVRFLRGFLVLSLAPVVAPRWLAGLAARHGLSRKAASYHGSQRLHPGVVSWTLSAFRTELIR